MSMGLCGGPQKARCAHFHDSSLRRSAQARKFGHQPPGGGLGLLDEHHGRGAPRQGLQSQSAGAGEQIQTAGAHDGVLQPVEQGLANSIGRRPQPGKIRETHPTAAPAAADDADGIAADLRLLRRRFGRLGRFGKLCRWHRRHHTLYHPGPMTNEADKPIRGFFKRLRAKLNTGPAWLTTDIKELLPGRKIDAEILDDLETRLISADVGAEAAARILGDLRKRVARKELDDVDALLKALHAAMLDILRPVEQPLHIDPNIKPYVILVVGINGAGKTTTIGKLAHRLLLERRTVMLAAGDTFRAAAREQLEVWAERNKVPIIAQQAGSEPAAVIYDGLQAAKARNIDVLIADTAGRLHTQTHLMDELKKVKRVLARLDPTAPHEVLLVLDGTIGQNAIAQAEEFNRGLGVTGLVITKLDGTAKGGVVLAIAQRLKIPIRFVGVGEQSEDFGVFNASEFVSALLKIDGEADSRDAGPAGAVANGRVAD
jgi:fused signal recognition particle receptor